MIKNNRHNKSLYKCHLAPVMSGEVTSLVPLNMYKMQPCQKSHFSHKCLAMLWQCGANVLVLILKMVKIWFKDFTAKCKYLVLFKPAP